MALTILKSAEKQEYLDVWFNIIGPSHAHHEWIRSLSEHLQFIRKPYITHKKPSFNKIDKSKIKNLKTGHGLEKQIYISNMDRKMKNI